MTRMQGVETKLFGMFFRREKCLFLGIQETLFFWRGELISTWINVLECGELFENEPLNIWVMHQFDYLKVVSVQAALLAKCILNCDY